MKILQIISGGDTGGAKTSVLTLMRGFQTIGLEAKIVCLMDGVFYQEACALKIPSVLIAQKHRFDFTVLDTIETLIEQEGYDLVNAHGARANFLMARLKKRLKIPVITTVHSDYRHDFDHNLMKRIVFTAMNIYALKRMDAYITMADYFKRIMGARGFDTSKIHVAYNGVDPLSADQKPLDPKLFFDQVGVPYDSSYCYVGIASRLHPIKGVDVFLSAAKIVVEKGLKVRFVVAGYGDPKYEQIYRHYVKREQLEDYVHFVGYIESIHQFYGSMDVNVNSSHSEAVCYALLEGALHQKPTVASKVGGTPELIVHESNGLLFEDDDAAGLAAHIIQLAKDPALRQTLGAALHHTVIEQFSVTAMSQAYQDIYHRLIKGSSLDKNIVVIGYYGYSNSGDDAILQSICDDIKAISKSRGDKGRIKMTVLSKEPEKTAAQFGIEAKNRFKISHIIKAISNSDLVVMGGGTLLQDRTSSRSLYYYLMVLQLAKMMGKKIMLFANGIGPISGRLNQRLTRHIVNRVEVISLREHLSLGVLEAMGIHGPKVYVTADPVFSMQPSATDIHTMKADYGVHGDYVLMMVRPWKENHRYKEAFIAMGNYIQEKYALQVVFLPMKYPYDLKISMDIAEGMTQTGVVISEKLSIEAVFGWIQDAKIILSMRLHGLIYAALFHVPMIGFEYDPKVAYYLEALDMPYGGHIHQLDLEAILKMVDHVCEHETMYHQRLIDKTHQLQLMAKENGRLLEAMLFEA